MQMMMIWHRRIYLYRNRNQSFPFSFSFGGGRGSNPGPCIFYVLSIPTKLSSRGQSFPFYVLLYCAIFLHVFFAD